MRYEPVTVYYLAEQAKAGGVDRHGLVAHTSLGLPLIFDGVLQDRGREGGDVLFGLHQLPPM
jgi:hypothetical protein